MDPVKPTVISIGTFNGGQAENIIASKVDMNGTVRTIDPGVHQTIHEIVERICNHTAATFGVEVSLDYRRLIPPLINSSEMVAKVVESSEAILGFNLVVETPISMGGDDFAFFLKEIPGSYFYLGTKNLNSGGVDILHNSHFDIDEDSLPIGTAILAHTALLVLQSFNEKVCYE